MPMRLPIVPAGACLRAMFLTPLLLAPSGCAATRAPSASASPLEGSAWVLIGLAGYSLPADAGVTLVFEDGRAGGSDGCNRYSSPYTASRSSFSVSTRGIATQMACSEERMEIATGFQRALAASERFRVGQASLELATGDGDVVARFAAMSRELTGTSWRATAVHDGRGAVVSVVPGTEVTMEFGADGRASGSAGCNRWHAGYRSGGASLRFDPVAATRMACRGEALATQEQAFLKALESVASARVEGDRLELRREDGAQAVSLQRAVAK